MSAPGPLRASTGKDEWRTPKYVFDYWNRRYDFTLDAAASKENAPCEKYYNITYDSLNNVWEEKQVAWLNPPFGDVGPWVERCIYEMDAHGSTIVALLPNSTEARWFHDIYYTASRITLLTGRISFIDQETGKGNGRNANGSIFVEWHPKPYGRQTPEIRMLSMATLRNG